MLYDCPACKKSCEDTLKPIPAEVLLRDFKKFVNDLTLTCPHCGGITVPDTVEPAVWMRLFSKCPSAMYCVECNSYRNECEQLIFYPGCLTFLMERLHVMRTDKN